MDTILVVDDEPNCLIVFTELLQEEGYEVFSAQNGEEGLKIVKESDLDLAIKELDEKMSLGITETNFAHHVRRKDIQTKGELPDHPYERQTIVRGSLPFLCLKCSSEYGSVGYILSAIAWRMSYGDL